MIRNFYNALEYLFWLAMSSVGIYIFSMFLIISILLIVTYLVYKLDIKKFFKLVLNENIFGVSFIILIIISTLCVTLYSTKYRIQHYNDKIAIYKNKLRETKKYQYVAHYDKSMLSYYKRNRTFIKHRKQLRLWMASSYLNNGTYYKNSSKFLRNKEFSNNLHYFPQSLFIKYNRSSGTITIEQDTKDMFNDWNLYKHSARDILLSEGDFDPLENMYMSRKINSLMKLPYSIYILKRRKLSNSNKLSQLFSYSYHIHKLSDVNPQYGLRLNHVPKFLYVSKKMSNGYVRKSLKVAKNKIKGKKYNSKLKYYRNKKKHLLSKSVAKYINACNFQIFIQFLITLIVFNILVNLCAFSYFIYMFLIIKFFYSNKNGKYVCNNIIGMSQELNSYYDAFILMQQCKFNFYKNLCHLLNFVYSLKESKNRINMIIDLYVFKLIPLVIAVMSGMFAIYSKGYTSEIFEALIKCTIPILSSIQFFRLMIQFYKK